MLITFCNSTKLYKLAFVHNNISVTDSEEFIFKCPRYVKFFIDRRDRRINHLNSCHKLPLYKCSRYNYPCISSSQLSYSCISQHSDSMYTVLNIQLDRCNKPASSSKLTKPI